MSSYGKLYLAMRKALDNNSVWPHFQLITYTLYDILSSLDGD